MNLYDKDDGFKIFTLKEANALLPKIIEITEQTVMELEQIKQRLEVEKIVDEDEAYLHFESESNLILEEWAEHMVELGVYPKGYFTVDFKSPIPDTLFCWTYGEEKISHTHKIYQSFKDRIPINDENILGFEQSLN